MAERGAEGGLAGRARTPCLALEAGARYDVRLSVYNAAGLPARFAASFRTWALKTG